MHVPTVGGKENVQIVKQNRNKTGGKIHHIQFIYAQFVKMADVLMTTGFQDNRRYKMVSKKPTQDELDKQTRSLVLSKVEDIVHDLLYKDRLEDKTLSSAQLFTYINSNLVSTSDIINTFARELRKEVK